MRRHVRLLMAIALLVLLAPNAAAAGKPPATTIERLGTDSFAVEIVRPQNVRNAYELWVASICYVDDVPISAAYLPVRYDPPSDPEPTAGVAGPFAFSGEECAAWAWYFPDIYRPVSDVLTFAP